MKYIGDNQILLEYKEAVLKITDNLEFLKATYLQARNDEVRQEIIDGIKSGTIKTKNDVRAITIKQAKGYQLLVENGDLPDFMKDKK